MKREKNYNKQYQSNKGYSFLDDDYSDNYQTDSAEYEDEEFEGFDDLQEFRPHAGGSLWDDTSKKLKKAQKRVRREKKNRGRDYSRDDYPRPKRRKKRKWTFLLIILLLLFLGWYYMLGGYNDASGFPHDDASLGITEDGRFGVINIACFGVDSRDNTDTGRSDAMMVVSVDVFHGRVSMISLLRDSKVPIENHGETKLNHAYAYGGSTLAVKTINRVFKTDIKEYVTVNFNQLAEIVDAVGGIDLEISEAERVKINTYMEDQFPGHTPVASSGTVHLDGPQSLSYSRIRYLDSDNARAGRQQEVLLGVFSSVKNMSPLYYPVFMHKFGRISETSLGTLDMMKLIPVLLFNPEPEQYTIPDAEFETDLRGGKDSDGVWYWHYNLDNAAQRLHSIIYGD